MINASAGDAALDQLMLEKVFSKWWSDLEGKLESIRKEAAPSARTPARSVNSIVEEVLEIVRRLDASERRDVVTTSLLKQRIKEASRELRPRSGTPRGMADSLMAASEYENLGLSAEVMLRLARVGVGSVEQLTRATEEELLSVPELEPKHVTEIREKLAAYRLSLSASGGR